MFFVNLLIYFLLPLLAIGYLFLMKKYSYFKDRDIPHMERNSLILGSLGDVGKKYHFFDFMKVVYNKCKDKGGVCGYYSLFLPTFLVTDLEIVKQITVKDFNVFTDRGMYVNEEVEPISGHLFSIEGEKWRFLRNKLSPAFTSGKIKMMYNTIADKGENFITALDKASKTGSVNIKNIATRFTVDVISSCAFGIEANTLDTELHEMMEILKKITGEGAISQFRGIFIAALPKLAKLLKLRLFDRQVNDFFNKMVRGSMEFREDNKVIRNDFMNMLIQLKNKGSIDGETSTSTKKLTMNECIAQAFVFFLGGAETSSFVISFAMLELGSHPEIQDKLRKEILEKTKSNNGEITYENLQEMSYLYQVVNETLRKFVPTPVTIRQASTDYKIPNSKIVIEKGSLVMIPSIAFHYDEKYWKSPETFDPERFLPEEIAKRPNLAFMPFGNGPRNCIGMRFGLVNTAFAIATIIKNYKVSLDTSKVRLPLQLDIKKQGMEPNGGYWVKIEKI